MSKELEKSIKWLSNVNNFKNVSRYSKEYFEHFNKVVKALKQAQKQEKLLELYRELNNKILHTYDMFGRITNKEWAKFANLQQQIKEQEDE